VTADECIALEDSENGLHASLAAGIKTFITINHFTRHHDFSGAAAVLDDLSDLPGFVRLSGLPLPGLSP
jgi:beta-phosphoglucomutase-like phosphatase (HAD superfamily)